VVTKAQSQPVSVGDLLQAKTITQADVDAAVDAFLGNPKVGRFKLAVGCVVDLTAAVKADRHATATLKEPTARPGSKRAAVKSALLLACPIVE
jgi:hypothetical protein